MTFFEWLPQRAKGKLPGRDAHKRFIPALRDAESRLSAPPPTARQSAVLVPLIESDTGIDVVLTVRSESLSNHSGQISFPGGRLDDYETPEQAAAREAFEEIGVPLSDINVMCLLSELYIPPSNSAVTPIVAQLPSDSSWVVNPQEVTEVFTKPLSCFLDNTLFVERKGVIANVPIAVPTWNVHPTIPLWGATAMILHEVVVLYNEYLSYDQ